MAYFYSGLSHTRIDAIYKGMIDRCYNKNNKRYSCYGKRGIQVCDEWKNDKRTFFKWAFENGYDINAPRGVCTLDRINNNKDYCPQNCRWVDMTIQENNRTNNRKITFKGETHTLAEWEHKKNFKSGLIHSRLKKGWSIERALCEVPYKGKNQWKVEVF